MRETKKLHIGLATVLMAILLGSALLVPTAVYAAEDNYIPSNANEIHNKVTNTKVTIDKITNDKETIEKDRKDKDTKKDDNKENNCDSEKYDKQCNNKDNNCDSEKYDKQCMATGKDTGKDTWNSIAVGTSDFEIPSR